MMHKETEYYPFNDGKKGGSEHAEKCMGFRAEQKNRELVYMVKFATWNRVVSA